MELTELSSRAWQGSLRVGLVAKLPKSLPSSLTELGEGSWALLGSSLLHNGSTVKQDFYTERLQLKVKKISICATHFKKFILHFRLGLDCQCGVRLMVGCMFQWMMWMEVPCCQSQLRYVPVCRWSFEIFCQKEHDFIAHSNPAVFLFFFQLPYVVVDLYGGAKSVKIIPLEEVQGFLAHAHLARYTITRA